MENMEVYAPLNRERDAVTGKYETRLKDVLDDQGRKQRWLCAKTKIHPTWMTKLVNGHSLPNAHDAQRIADALDESIEYLWPLPKEENKNERSNVDGD